MERRRLPRTPAHPRQPRRADQPHPDEDARRVRGELPAVRRAGLRLSCSATASSSRTPRSASRPTIPKTIYVTTSGQRAGTERRRDRRSDSPTPRTSPACSPASMTQVEQSSASIGGTELPPVEESFAAFERGAHGGESRRSRVAHLVHRQLGRRQRRQGAGARADRAAAPTSSSRTPTPPASASSRRRARRRSVYVIGSNSNQNGVAPDVTLGSVVIDLPHALLLSHARSPPATSGRACSPWERSWRWSPGCPTRRSPPASRRRPVNAVDSLQAMMRAGTFHVPGLEQAFPDQD